MARFFDMLFLLSSFTSTLVSIYSRSYFFFHFSPIYDDLSDVHRCCSTLTFVTLPRIRNFVQYSTIVSKNVSSPCYRQFIRSRWMFSSAFATSDSWSNAIIHYHHHHHHHHQTLFRSVCTPGKKTISPRFLSLRIPPYASAKPVVRYYLPAVVLAAIFVSF